MKKLTLLICLFIFTNSFSQETEEKEKSSELKINAFNILIFKSIDMSYEYLINSESGIGLSFLANLNNENDRGPNYNENYAVTLYYRHYFSRKYAWGFFMEGFGMYNEQDSNNDFYYSDTDFKLRSDTTSNFAFGMSVGGKFVSQKGFVFEFYGGIGRNLFTSDTYNNYEFVPRLGTSFGYRF